MLRDITQLVLIFLLPGGLISQTSDSLNTASDVLDGFIKAEVKVSSSKVPQNAEFSFTIKIDWYGDLERYQIENPENPTLTNLELVGNASSNHVGETGGRKVAEKIYTFTLKPIDMGMAYIDGTVIQYKDLQNGEMQKLVTNRLQVEVVEPVFHNKPDMWTLILGLVLSLAIIIAVVFAMRRRKMKRVQNNKVEVEFTLIEDKYHTELQQKIDLKTQDKVALFSALSKLFKGYLSERYQIETIGKSTPEMLDALNGQAVADKILETVEEILKTSDVAKFSGGNIEDGVFERTYTLVEDVFRRNKSDFIEDTNMINENHK